MANWELESTESKLIQIIEEAVQNGPQTITVKGFETAVILSIADYRRVKPPRERLSDFFRRSPLAEVDIEFDRDQHDC